MVQRFHVLQRHTALERRKNLSTCTVWVLRRTGWRGAQSGQLQKVLCSLKERVVEQARRWSDIFGALHATRSEGSPVQWTLKNRFSKGLFRGWEPSLSNS